MRRVSASTDHRTKSPSVEAGKSKAPLLAINRWSDSSNGTVAIHLWGAFGTLADFTPLPGGVRFPGAPLLSKIASIYP